MKVLLTRPVEDLEETVRRLEVLGHDTVLAPMLDISFDDAAELPEHGVQAWAATSRNGVRALVRADARHDIPLFAVGRSTAALARESGFRSVHDADGDGDDLARLIAAELQPEDGSIVHASGRDAAGDLAARLSESGFEAKRCVLYSAEMARSLPEQAVSDLAARQIDAALFFSKRAADAFGNLVRSYPMALEGLSGVAAVCVSSRAATGLADLPFASVTAAERPNLDALLAQLQALDIKGRSQNPNEFE